jgi:hypothetical protein
MLKLNGRIEEKEPTPSQRVPAWPKIVLPTDVEDPYGIGTKMKDGTIYAGISPDTRTPMFVMPKDERHNTRLSWLKTTIARLNRRKKRGHNDWRLPTFAELYVLYKNQNKGALSKTFNAKAGDVQGWYFSSAVAGKPEENCLWAIKFMNGQAKKLWQDNDYSVRLVSTPKV